MSSYGYTATGSAEASANIATDKVRISTITPIHFEVSYPNVAGTGTVTCATTSATVTGSGTTFTTAGVGYLAPGYWVGNATGTTVGIVSSVTSATVATLRANANVAITAAGYTSSPYGVAYTIATANSRIAPGNTELNSVIVGQGNIVSYLNPSGITANVFTVTELGMPHANTGTTGY